MNKPILLVGLPRSGTTWIASVLGATAGTAYFHEPFNYLTVKESAPFTMRYLRAADNDPAFATYCNTVFAGRQRHRSVVKYQSKWQQWLPGRSRVLIKDVHVLLALDWIDRHFGPRIVILMRDPLAMADSWFRMTEGSNDMVIDRLLNQPALSEDYLQPFEEHIRSANDFWSRIGTYWAACYHVALQQQRKHPDWIVVRHEDFVEDPQARFRDLCARLDLRWTPATERFLQNSNAEDSTELYVPRRILAEEKEKWRKRLTGEQVESVLRGAAPFNVPAYPKERGQPCPQDSTSKPQ